MYIGPWQEFNAYNLFRERQEKFDTSKLQPLPENQFLNSQRKAQVYPYKIKRSPSLRNTTKRLPSLYPDKYVLNSAKPGSEPGYSTSISSANGGNTARDSLYSSSSDPLPYIIADSNIANDNHSSYQQNVQHLSLPSREKTSHHSSPRSARSNQSITLKKCGRKSMTIKNSMMSNEAKIKKVQHTKALYMKPNKIDVESDIDVANMQQVVKEKLSYDMSLPSSSSSSSSFKFNSTGAGSDDISNDSSSSSSSSEVKVIQDMTLESTQLREISKYFQRMSSAVALNESSASSCCATSTSLSSMQSAVIAVMDKSKSFTSLSSAASCAIPTSIINDDDDDDLIDSGGQNGYEQNGNDENEVLPYSNYKSKVNNEDEVNSNGNKSDPPWSMDMTIVANDNIKSSSSSSSSSGMYTGLYVQKNSLNKSYNNYYIEDDNDDNGTGIDILLNWSLNLQIP